VDIVFSVLNRFETLSKYFYVMLHHYAILNYLMLYICLYYIDTTFHNIIYIRYIHTTLPTHKNPKLHEKKTVTRSPNRLYMFDMHYLIKCMYMHIMLDVWFNQMHACVA
jgi:hypothetical protein